jgi:arylformamidase
MTGLGFPSYVSANGRIVSVAGQCGVDADGRLVGSDPYAQFRAALTRVAGELVKAGAGPHHLVHMTWYVTERGWLDDRRRVDRAYREVFAGFRPGLTVVSVPTLRPQGAVIEVQALATVPPPADATVKVYRGYGPAELIFQYSPRMGVPNHLEIMARWRLSEADFRRTRRSVDDIAFGNSEAERLDLFMPPGAKNPPLHVFIHGGYWQAMDKGDCAQFVAGMPKSGIAAAVLNYGLCPDVTLAEIVEQMRRALAFLWRSAERYGYDANRIQVAGHSAGGHLAAMMAATDWPAYAKDLPADLVKSTVLVSGLFDLEPLMHLPHGKIVGLPDFDTARRLSPAFMSPPAHLRVLAIAGGAESREFLRQTEILAEAWRPKVKSMEHVVIPEHDHFVVIEPVADGPYTAKAVALATG